MTDFCDIQLPSGVSEKDVSFRIKKRSSSGHSRIRPQGRSPIKEFKLSWDFLTSADKAILQTFFNDNFATSFNWTHFETDVVYTVCFSDEELDFEYAAVGYWKVDFKIEEI